jgi:hypothetical protein
MYITVYTNGDISGTLYIAHDGTMEAQVLNACSSNWCSAWDLRAATDSVAHWEPPAGNASAVVLQ